MTIYGFDKNEDVTSNVFETYMDALDKLTGSGDVAQFLMGRNGIRNLTRMTRTTPEP